MKDSKRPISVVIACILIATISGALLLRLLQRPIPTDTTVLPVFIGVVLSIGLGVVIAIVAWFGKGWVRWVYVIWLLLPIFSGAAADVVLLDRELSEQIVHNFVGLFTLLFGIASVLPVVLLFLPASNRWFAQCR